MRPLASFIAQQIPRYSPNEFEIRGYENLLGQRALWSGLAFLAMARGGYGVEVRLSSEANRKVELSLHVLPGVVRSPADKHLDQIERLLPREYGWVRGLSLFDREASEHTQETWRIAKVIRRVEFLDLPYHSPLMATASALEKLGSARRSRSGKPAAAENRNSKIATAAEPPSVADSFGRLFSRVGAPAGDPSQRRIPEQTTLGSELQSQRFCVPLLGSFDGIRPRSRRLLDELLDAAPAIVSFCMYPVSPDVTKGARRVAGNLKRFLAPFASEIANAGFGDSASLQSVYDRYFLPDAYLMRGSVRVAAKHEVQATAVATLVGSTLGGLRAFQIHPSTKEVRLDLLRDEYLDLPAEIFYDMHKKDSEFWKKRCQRLLHEADLDLPKDDKELIDFLIRFPHIYSLEEVERLAQLPIADDEGLPGFETQLVPPFTAPVVRFDPVLDQERVDQLAPPPEDRVRIGMVRQSPGLLTPDGDASQHRRYQGAVWHTISRDDLTKHALIVGSTGSGKTLTTLFLARELDRLGVPILVIEPVKTEYYARLHRHKRLSNLYRVRLEGNAAGEPTSDFLTFDPLRIQRDVTVARHASYLKSCFEAAFPLDPVMALLLENGLLEYYTAPVEDGGCDLKKFDRGGEQICKVVGEQIFPSFATFRNYFTNTYLPREFKHADAQVPGSRSGEWQEVFKRRFANLGDGLIGECFKRADKETLQNKSQNYDHLGRMLSVNVIVELDAIPDADHKALVMAFILTYVFERRQAEDFRYREDNNGRNMPSHLRHLMIVEEAHRVLSASARGGSSRNEIVGQDSKAKAVNLFVDMLAEIRAFGQGLAIVEQIPTKIVPEAVKNTNLKIMLRLTSKEDRDYLGEAMNFSESQKRFVTSLKVSRGDAVNFVAFEEGIDQPLMLSLPHVDREDWLFDEFFKGPVSP